jgi:SAM-dependent methyltransferase
VNAPATPIGATLVSARSGAEYAAMFGLDLTQLVGRRVLDCPGGAAAFAADAAALGADVTAVDPVYAGAHEELVAHAHAETLRGNDYVRREPDRYVWTYFRDAAEHLTERSAAVDRFATDRAANPDRYVAASLPSLPLPDDAFDLALSSHLLFTYDDRLDVGFHEVAIVELLRVAREVRCFPTLSMSFERSAAVAPVVAAAEAAGADVALVPSPYEFQRGGSEMVVARRARRP